MLHFLQHAQNAYVTTSVGVYREEGHIHPPVGPHTALVRLQKYQTYQEGAVRPVMCCCRLQSCCCCALREGSLAVGIIDLILSAIGIGLQVWSIVSTGSGVINPYVFGNIGVYGISIVFSLILIFGALKNNACSCLAWVIWSSICLALDIALLVWICVGTFVLVGLTAGSGLGAVIAIGLIPVYITIAILVVLVIFLIYGIMVVNSFRQELNEAAAGYPASYPMQAV
ncbi:uncharacterized protein LOC144884528 isoform X1 [Branchiostoma floridae x Branchiostoma japonicum]